MLAELIEKAVDHTIDETFKSTIGITNYLKSHPKKKNLIENLCTEINLTQLHTNVKITSYSIRKIVEDFTKLYAHAALAQKEKEIKSKRDEKLFKIIKGDG